MLKSDLMRVQLSKLSYEPDRDTIERTLIRTFFQEIKDVQHFHIPRTDTEGFAVSMDDTLFIVCCGTDSFKDALTDISAWKDPYLYNDKPSGRLHHGFNIAGKSIKNNIRHIHKTMFWNDPEIKTVEFIGHSLGGIVALVASDMFLSFHENSIQAYRDYSEQITTFGCPAGWSKEGASKFNERHHVLNHTRFTNPLDPVTKVPIFSRHTGTRIKLKGSFGHSLDKYERNIYNLENTETNG